MYNQYIEISNVLSKKAGDHMKRIHISFTTRILIVVILVLVVVNVISGYIIIDISRSAIKVQIDKRMQEMADTAADHIDGDLLINIQKEDKGTPEYESLLDDLRLFQSNSDMKYIYCIRIIDENNYIITLFPDEKEDYFGVKVHITNALRKAALGTPAVDEEPHMDMWGKCYGAYSPVYDSHNNLAGIIGVHYEDSWYDAQVSKGIRVIVLSSVISILVGIMLGIFVTTRFRNKTKKLNQEIIKAEKDIEAISREMSMEPSDDKNSHNSLLMSYRTDELDALGYNIEYILEKMRAYATYIDETSYIDKMTGVANKKAYVEKKTLIDERMKNGETLIFSVIVFDVKNVKYINDQYGFEFGDMVIANAADAINRTFIKNGVYHIGGDEFVVIIEGEPEDSIPGLLRLLDEHIESINTRNSEYEFKLDVYSGYATYDPDKDNNYRSVFGRADQNMFENKRG